MSTQLQVVTTVFEPAKVEFNFEQLSSILDESLTKYAGLEFTEKTAGECKKTIAELRKGKTMLDTYRKDTKKRLTESIAAFEDQCKELAAKFDAVINPLTEQHDQFEHDRKERKRREIQELIDSLIVQEGLDAKRAAQMVILDEYLNKGKSVKDIKTELTALASSLGIAQDKEEADIELIKTKVELANAKHGLKVGLVDTAYVALLEFQSIDSIVEKVNADAETIQQREATVRPDLIPPKPASTPSVIAAVTFTENYVVDGTEEQLDLLEAYMDELGVSWSTK